MVAPLTPQDPPHTITPDTIEVLDRARRRMLVAVVLTSTLWLGPQILVAVAEDLLSGAVVAGLSLAGVVGAVAWMVFMWRVHRLQRRVLRQPDLRRRLDDERTGQLRREAGFRAWVLLVVVLGAGVAASPFATLPDQAVLLTLLLLAVNAPIVFFLVLDRDRS
jgi:hypothetical protein